MQTISTDTNGNPSDRSLLSVDAPRRTSNTLLRKLLLVDDEIDGAQFAAILLRSHGLVVLVVHSATAALQALQQEEDIDAVLSDIMMPGMTGLQLADTIRSIYPAIKIVLMSGYVMPELLRDRERDYMFVEKPYKIDTLLQILRS